MQDDLADGALGAIDQGIADPIIGAGYGGYAALMGMAMAGAGPATAPTFGSASKSSSSAMTGHFDLN